MLLLIVGIVACEAISLDCNFGNVIWTNAGLAYTCTATIQGLGIPVLTNVTGDHSENRTNDDVGALAISNQDMEFGIPQNIVDFFPNLIVLSLSNLGIYRVSSLDIAQFPALQVLILYRNQLDSLDGNLFVNNPLLLYINLSSNQIKHLGPNIFNPLRNLRVLRMTLNICIDEYADDAAKIAAFRWRASFQCPPSFEQIESEILNGNDFREIVNPLTLQIEELERRIEALEAETKNA